MNLHSRPQLARSYFGWTNSNSFCASDSHYLIEIVKLFVHKKANSLEICVKLLKTSKKSRYIHICNCNSYKSKSLFEVNAKQSKANYLKNATKHAASNL